MWDINDYNRDLNIRRGTVEQIAKYTALKLNKPYDEVYEHVRKEISTNAEFRVKDRHMPYLQKVRDGEREKRDITFLKYLDLAVETGRILSPSLVVYQTAEENKSVTADWLDTNINLRRKSKSEMFRLGQLGDEIGSQLANYDQNAKKIRINSVSGMRGFSGCPIFIKTGHSSLTSMCRAAAGYGNATVERFLGGVRHYHTPEVVKANLVAMTTIEPIDKWTEIVTKYNLHLPTADEVYTMVHRSSEDYWRNADAELEIKTILTNMTPIERAICLYSGDLYHLAIYNEEFVKQYINDSIILELPDYGEFDYDAEIKGMAKTDAAFIYSLCAEELRGTQIDLLQKDNPEGYKKVAITARAVREVSAKYYDLINLVFTPSHLPPTVGNIRDSTRAAGIIADTDSTIFTTQWWVEWMTGHIKRGYVEDRVWYFTTYAVCQCIAHNLALLSANVGVERKFITRLAMKNEYGFPVLMNTNMGKTYAALVSIREGNVFEKYDLDLKGVQLRGSSAPKEVLDGIRNMIDTILNTVDRGEKLNAYELIKYVAEYECHVIRSVNKGEYGYLRSSTIKQDGNKVQHNDLWKKVFERKYGSAGELPIPVVKLSLDLPNKTSLRNWIDSIEDKQIAKDMAEWLDANNRNDFKTTYLPYQVVRTSGIPKELRDISDIKKIVYDTCSGFYYVLEACGLFIVDRDYHRLAYEFLDIDPFEETS